MSIIDGLCDKCGIILSLRKEDYEEKLVSHQLWNHPTESQQAALLVDMYLHVQSVIANFQKENYIKASIVANDLTTLALRAKKYADNILEKE